MRQIITFFHSGIMRFVAPTMILAFALLIFQPDFDRSILAISSLSVAKILHAGKCPCAMRLDVAVTSFAISWIPVFRIFALVGSSKAHKIRKCLLSGENVRAPPPRLLD
jgi:hypothetical protein